MSSYYSNLLKTGQRFWFHDRPCTLVDMSYDYDNLSYSSYARYSYKVEFNDEGGGTHTLDDYGVHRLYEGLIYDPMSGLELGDTLEIKRDGLDPNLRGRLLEIDENAERYPYRVGEEGGNSVWFSFAELSKVHSVISRERSPRALEVLRKTIAEKREELEALETALEVLEYATT